MGKKIFILTGEASGEAHASILVNELKDKDEFLQFYGIGSDLLKTNDVKLIQDYKEINFIGFTAVISNLNKIRHSLRNTIDWIKHNNPDVIILVDFPGYNLKIVKSIRTFYNGKIVYYISPQLWAWHIGRIEIIRKCIDLMLVIFPFEVEFYKNEGIKAFYTGHPLKNKIIFFLDKNTKTKNILPVISIMPGSRHEEIANILPELLKSAIALQKEFNSTINLICSSNINESFYRDICINVNINYIFHNRDENIKYKTIFESDLILAKSGTSTLECALIGTPFLVVYKTNFINYLIGKSLIKVKFVSIVNILSKRKIVNEYIQSGFTQDNILAESRKILNDNEYRNKMIADFNTLREDLFFRVDITSASNLIYKLINT